MDNLLFFAACLLTAVGVIFLLVFFIMNSVTNYRILIKMLNHERVDLDIDERKYERIKYLIPFDGVDRYLIRIGVRKPSSVEVFFRRWGKLCVWASVLLWLLHYNDVSELWEYLVILFMSVVVEFAILAVFSFITAIISNRCYKQAYKKYQPEK